MALARSSANRVLPLLVATVLSVGTLEAADDRTWTPIAKDGLHDPELEALSLLQEPAEALSQLPYDYIGNKVRWVEALRDGHIAPRAKLYPSTEIDVLDLDIIMGNTGEMGMVRFPHKPHTEWLGCENCHDSIFIPKVDANPMNMLKVLAGEYCGICHGAISFPLVECLRCHSVLRRTFKGRIGAQPINWEGTNLMSDWGLTRPESTPSPPASVPQTPDSGEPGAALDPGAPSESRAPTSGKPTANDAATTSEPSASSSQQGVADVPEAAGKLHTSNSRHPQVSAPEPASEPQIKQAVAKDRAAKPELQSPNDGQPTPTPGPAPTSAPTGDERGPTVSASKPTDEALTP